MIPFEMVMRHTLVHRASEMSLAQRDDPIPAFFFDRIILSSEQHRDH
jgi:hypothetical protein